MKLTLFTAVLIILSVSSSPIIRSERGTKDSRKRSESVRLNTAVKTDTVELKILCAVGMRQVMLTLVPKFQQATKYLTAINFNSSGEIVKEVGDKSVDVVIIFRPALEKKSNGRFFN